MPVRSRHAAAKTGGLDHNRDIADREKVLIDKVHKMSGDKTHQVKRGLRAFPEGRGGRESCGRERQLPSGLCTRSAVGRGRWRRAFGRMYGAPHQGADGELRPPRRHMQGAERATPLLQRQHSGSVPHHRGDRRHSKVQAPAARTLAGAIHLQVAAR
jgi:hypothetical protein